MKKSGILKLAREVLRIEERAIARLRAGVGRDFEKAVQWMADCKGRVILTGMGKPGFIARKIAATMASTGTPSMYLHPAEAVHGDFGMVTSKDLMIAISQSGESEEIVRLLPLVKKKGVKIIALTSVPRSSLGRNADIVLDLGVRREACPLNLAPSASTTASLAMGTLSRFHFSRSRVSAPRISRSSIRREVSAGGSLKWRRSCARGKPTRSWE